MKNTKKRNNWKIAFWSLLGITIILGWITISFIVNSGNIYEDAWNESKDYYGNLTGEAIEELAEIDFFKCINYHCDNYFECGINENNILPGLEDTIRECGDIFQYEDETNRFNLGNK